MAGNDTQVMPGIRPAPVTCAGGPSPASGASSPQQESARRPDTTTRTTSLQEVTLWLSRPPAGQAAPF